MRLVVDANVIISSLIKKGVSFEVFALNSIQNRFEFVAPDLMLSEVQKHKGDLLNETRLPADIFSDAMDFLFEQINIVPAQEFKEFLPKTRELLSSHAKDVPYVALALKLDCPIFSGDKMLKKASPVRILSPRELLDSLTGRGGP